MEDSISRNPVIVWFAQDLRVHDHRALTAAAKTGAPVIPLYILDDGAGAEWRLGAATRWWLHMSLMALDHELQQRGSRLILRRGSSLDVLGAIAQETNARAIYWTRRYEPWAVRREAQAFRELARLGVQCRRFTGTLLFEPEDITNTGCEAARTFSAFARACEKAVDPGPLLPAPMSLATPPDSIISDSLEDWDLQLTRPDWVGDRNQSWTPGEPSARERLDDFHDKQIGKYADLHDQPEGTSRLSPHLHFGEISPRTYWQAANAAAAKDGKGARGAQAFLRELLWREFCHHTLFHFPQLPDVPLKLEFNDFPWREDETALSAWQRGMTGYPIVDAGMRELKQTGWLHNRMRMIVASFLVKHLLIPWQKGEAWFWDGLLDANLANNAANWQWVAGSGADAAPYFRILNPVLQGKKFDPEGTYIRRFVPELAELPDKYIHAPWAADEAVLEEAGVRLGDTYPEPIIDHKQARMRALRAFETIKDKAKASAA